MLCPVVIGRDAELTELDAALTTAMAGHGGCAVITGEPGIGKSRLAAATVTIWVLLVICQMSPFLGAKVPIVGK